jgi:hypothetical protein
VDTLGNTCPANPDTLGVFEASLEARLRAVRRARQPAPDHPAGPSRSGLSQVDIAYDILRKARTPLHIAEILSRLEASCKVSVDRESLVSSLTENVARGDRFVRTARTTFGLLPESR